MHDDPLSSREHKLQRVLTNIELFSRYVIGVPLRPYQLEPARAILRSVFGRQGLTFTVMMSRQAGKNELSAHLEAFLLTRFMRRGGSIVKAAPTFQPQLANSILRLQRALDNPLTRGHLGRQLGAITLEQARISFFSGEPAANVVGATASILLEIDEAQDFDEEKYLKDFRPMGASTNVTTVLYGTAWTADTLLERARCENLRLEALDGIRRDFRYPWHVVAEQSTAYRQFVESEIERMGADHPLVRTQYLLDPLESMSRLLSETQLAQLRGTHSRPAAPDAETRGRGAVYVAGIDIAGEDEEAQDAALRRLKPRKDSTAVTICEVTWPRAYGVEVDGERGGRGDGEKDLAASPRHRFPSRDEPHLRVVQHYWWTGRRHRELFATLVDLLKNVWRCRAVVVDATGVGAGVASFLAGALPGVARPFVFTAGSKSALGYGLLSAVNGGRLKMYADDASSESAELWRQARLARSMLHENQRLSFYVDPREGHDDLLISLALAVEAAAGAEPRIARGRRLEGPNSRKAPYRASITDSEMP